MSALEDGAPGQDGGGGGSEAKAPVCATPIPPSIKVLTTILPAQGPYCLVWRKIINEKSKWIHEYFGDVPLMYLRAMDLKLKHDVYFATHAMSEAWAEEYKNSGGRPSSSREKKDMGEGRCLHIDVDVDPIKAVKAKAYNTRKEAAAALRHFIARNALPTPIVINSGGGLHVYWPFTRSLSPAAWLAFAERFNTLVRLCGFRVDPSRTTDIASILRMLDTLNHKNPGEPRRVSVKEPIGNATEVEELIAIVDRALTTFPQVEVAQALSGNSRRGEAQASDDAAKDPFNLDAKPMRDARRKLTPPAETAEYIAWVETALIAIGPNLAYPEWRDTAFSVMATGWSRARELLRTWSAKGDDWTKDSEEASGALDVIMDGYDAKRPDAIGFGSLVKRARDAGHTVPLPGQAGAVGAVLTADDDVDLAHLRGPSDDTWNGRRFARHWRGRLRYIPQQDERNGYWLVFDFTSGWRVADFGEVERAAITSVEVMVGEVSRLVAFHGGNAEHPDVKRLSAQLKYSRKGVALRELIRVARALPGMSATEGDFDGNPMHLGVANGVLNLNTGTLLPVTPDLMVRLRCSVAFDPSATCPTFERFLARMQPDPEQRAFLGRWLFYCLTGRFGEKKFVFHHGPDGNNGKSTLLELFASMVGNYARKIATESLMEHKRNAQSHDADLAVIRNKRFLFASETRPGQRLSSDRIKDLTGGDTVVARRPHEKEALQLRPTFKLNMYGNHLPVIDDPSRAMWSRVLVLEWNVVISDTDDDFDPDLRAKLLAEAPGLLNWVLGARAEYLAGGLAPPAAVLAAAESYRKEENTISAFVAERCRVGDGLSVEKDRLYEAYADWWKGQGHTSEPGTNKLFTRRIGKEGYLLLPDKRRIGGLCLASSPSTLASVSPLKAV